MQKNAFLLTLINVSSATYVFSGFYFGILFYFVILFYFIDYISCNRNRLKVCQETRRLHSNLLRWRRVNSSYCCDVNRHIEWRDFFHTTQISNLKSQISNFKFAFKSNTLKNVSEKLPFHNPWGDEKPVGYFVVTTVLYFPP